MLAFGCFSLYNTLKSKTILQPVIDRSKEQAPVSIPPPG